MIRAFEKENPSIKKNWTDISRAILEKEEAFSDISIDFTENEEAEPPSRKLKLLRFQQNPPNWGPKSKARQFCGETEPVDKREKNQGKYSGNEKKRQFNDSPDIKTTKKEKLDNENSVFSS